MFMMPRYVLHTSSRALYRQLGVLHDAKASSLLDFHAFFFIGSTSPATEPLVMPKRGLVNSVCVYVCTSYIPYLTLPRIPYALYQIRTQLPIAFVSWGWMSGNVRIMVLYGVEFTYVHRAWSCTYRRSHICLDLGRDRPLDIVIGIISFH